MNIMGSLAVRQLLQNKKRTAVTLIGILLSVSMMTAITGFVVSARDMLLRTFIEYRGNYHACLAPVTAEQIRSLSADSRIERGYRGTVKLSETEEETAFYFRIRNVDKNYGETVGQIAADYGIDAAYTEYNKELLAAEGVIIGEQSVALYTVAGILILIILLGSVIVIANAFYISASERAVQFGILKSAGATKAQIRGTVLAEGLVLSLVAIPLGILAGFAVEGLALFIANKLLYEINQINRGVLHFKFLFSGWAILGAGVLSLATVFLSAWFPARRAAKMSAIEAITLSGEVCVKPGEVSVSPVIYKLFGFEGALAAKALKRSRRKYRATVLSLVVSIVLYILGSGFGAMVMQSADIVYKDFGINVIMNRRAGNAREIESISAGLTGLTGTISASKTLYAKTEIPEGFLSRDGRAYWKNEPVLEKGGSGHNMQLITVSEPDFAALCREAGISPEWPSKGDALGGILVNLSIADGAGRRVAFKPFQYQKGERFTVAKPDAAETYTLALYGAISDLSAIPPSVAPFISDAGMNVVIPESAFQAILGDSPITQAYWAVKSEDPAGYCKAAEEIFKSVLPDENYSVINFEQNARATRSLNLLFMTFVYGFVGMLSLIAVTSVLCTISTNLALRIPELAVLSSVGMTPEGVRRMLNLESLFYGVKALFIGLPISLLLYYLLYRAFGISVGFLFIWPWKSMLICVAAVLLITFAAMRYSAKTLRGRNIVEGIRKINI